MGILGSLTALVATSLVVAALEYRHRRRAGTSQRRRRHLLTDVGWYGVTVAAAIVAAVVFRPYLERLAIGPFEGQTARWPFWVQALSAVVVYDAVTFAMHIGFHRRDRLWEFHKVHHSSRHLDGLAATRTHMFEHLLRGIPAQAAVLALGLPVAALGVALAVYAAAAIVGHSELQLPSSAERMFVTPRLHRVHHVPATTGSNYGTVLTIWDRAFRTFEPPVVTPDSLLGVPGEEDTYPQRFADAVREPVRRQRARRDRPRDPFVRGAA